MNPGTNRVANQKQNPLIIREKLPRESSVMGSENSCISGLIELLINPMEMAAKIATGKVAIATPGTKKSTTIKLIAVTNVVRTNPNIICFSSLVRG